MSKRRDPEWRDRASSDLFVRHLPEWAVPGPVLVIEDALRLVSNALLSEDLEVAEWNRRAWGGRSAAAWPPRGPFCSATLRLSRAKEELIMSLHAAASTLAPGSPMLVYGSNDEGVQAAVGPLMEVGEGVETVAIGGRCRVLRGFLRGQVPGLKPSLEAWKSAMDLGDGQLPSGWVSYPGVFAHGRLDEGTLLLLGALPSLPAGARVLDFGCGSGIVGYTARSLGEGIVTELLDVDAVALEAAKENLPGSPVHLRDGLLPAEEGPFDAIFSNPPFHRGKAEDPGMIFSMVRGAPSLLKREGLLVFVAQRRIFLEQLLQQHFRTVSILAEDRTYRVWMGRNPK